MVGRRPNAIVEGDVAALQLIGATLASAPLRGRPKAVISSEQTLSHESRAAIERNFEAPVFDRYGSHNFGAIAHECDAHRGQHVNAESYIVEIVRDGRAARPGETGDLLITDLTNLCVPLIRYATGDRATATDRQCSCGRGLPLIDDIHGRPAAVIVGANGSCVSATFFADALRDYGYAIKQFQVTQSEPGALTLSIVKGPRFSDAALQRLLNLVRRHLGADTAIDVQPVERIPAAAAQAPVLSRLCVAPTDLATSVPVGLAASARVPESQREEEPAVRR
jgi:phenylacetate-CoA ligase